MAWPTVAHAEWIDSVTPDNPTLVYRYDGHMRLANSLALRLGGITRDTPNPSGGTIVKDEAGEPTGLLKDAAMTPVLAVIPERTEDQRLRNIRAALAEAARFGVTGIDDISSTEDVRLYQKLAAHSQLTLRIDCLTPMEQWESLAHSGILAGFGNDWVRVGGIKGFADGSLGSTTALFFEPYTDAPQTSGLPNAMMFPAGTAETAVGQTVPVCKLPYTRLEIKPTEISWTFMRKRRSKMATGNTVAGGLSMRSISAHKILIGFARLGVIASVQPYHAIDDGRWAENRIGHERCKTL